MSRIEHATTTPTRDSLDQLLAALGLTLDATATASELLCQVERSLSVDRDRSMELSA